MVVGPPGQVVHGLCLTQQYAVCPTRRRLTTGVDQHPSGWRYIEIKVIRDRLTFAASARRA